MDLIRGLLERDPDKRYGFEQLRSHPYLAQGSMWWTSDIASSKAQRLFRSASPLLASTKHVISRSPMTFPLHDSDRDAIMQVMQARQVIRARFEELS